MSEEKTNLSWLLEGISEIKNESLDDSQKHFKKEIDLINYIAAVLGSLAIFTADHNRQSNTLLSDTYPCSDLLFHAHMTDIVNTFLATKELCLNGFDTQARSLVRVLDERIYQNLILFSNPEDYIVWSKDENSKQAHYKLFSKKKSIFKKIRALEEKYLNQQNSEELLAIRKENEEYYSDSIHGAHISVYAGCVAYPFSNNLDDNDILIPAIFGRASSSSFQTLHHSICQMAYFIVMIDAILEDVHSLKSIECNDLIDTYKNNRCEVIHKALNLT